MYIRRNLLLILLAFVVAPGLLFAAPPPLSEEELKDQAALIVSGTVTEVKVGQPTARGEYATEYVYDLTVLVDTVKKGKFEEGATLIVRGLYMKLKTDGPDGPAIGNSGHRSDNTSDRMNAIEPGWELVFYLTEPKDGVHGIVNPNGFAVLNKPPREVSDSLCIWIAVGGGAALLIFITHRRNHLKRAEK